MASIKMVELEEATGKVKEMYQEIMDEFGIDFAPNMYKVMGHKPDSLRRNGRRLKWSCGRKSSTS